jgi:phosphoglycolate phosphatase
MVFDLDGTLVHSVIDYRKMVSGATEILKAHGVEVEPSQRRIWEILQRSEEQLEKLGLNANDWKEINRKITEHLNAVELENVDKVTVIEGAKETLEGLKGMGIKIGIATRSCNAATREALRRTGLDAFVDVLLARDDVPYPKPDPRHLLQVIEALQVPLNKVIFMGDTTTDLRTAREAGVTFIGFSMRPEGAERLCQEGCEIVLEDLRQLPNLLDRNCK